MSTINYNEFNKVRNSINTNLKEVLREIDVLANQGNFKNTDSALDVLMIIHERIDLGKRALNTNYLLQEDGYKNWKHWIHKLKKDLELRELEKFQF